MTAKMTAVREALDGWPEITGSDDIAAALAEVEEWETRARHSQDAFASMSDAEMYWRDRAEAAEADLRVTEGLATDERERRVAAVAEADRLKAALEGLLPWAGKQTFENDAAWVIARAALAPADRNTT